MQHRGFDSSSGGNNSQREGVVPRGNNTQGDRSRSPFRPYQVAAQLQDAPSGQQHYEYYQQPPYYEPGHSQRENQPLMQGAEGAGRDTTEEHDIRYYAKNVIQTLIRPTVSIREKPTLRI